MQKSQKAKIKVNVVTLGCSKNLVDSELLLKQFDANSFEIVHDFDGRGVDIVAINTCGFISEAKEESIETIMSYVDAKSKGQVGKIFVFGCLSARYGAELAKEISEIDGVYGKFEIKKMIDELGSEYKMNLSSHRYLTTPSHYAYLKISEGCSRKCSYCAIPRITGLHVSKPIISLVEEAKLLADKGVKELLVVAQDLSSYGLDIRKKHMLPDLVNRLADINSFEWIKLHYAYPVDFPYKLLDVMRERNNVSKYLDIALQHVSDNMLRMMRRNSSKQETIRLLKQIRDEVPGIHLRTAMLIGHPGETEKDFDELKEFVLSAKFERLGVFSYSHEEGTYAGENYTDSVPYEVKKERADALMEIQRQLSAKIGAEKIGDSMKVVVDRKEGKYFVGRTEFDSPEVDGEVFITSDKEELSVGNFYDVTITDAEDYDLYASVKSVN